MNKVTGCGILPFIIINKRPYFILYRNSISKKYEDLGGLIDNTDSSFYQTASREAYEESATYINIKQKELNNARKIFLKEYICFLKRINDFNTNIAMDKLRLFKDKEHYNEMDNILIMSFSDFFSNNLSVKFSGRLNEIKKVILNWKKFYEK